MLGVGSLTGGVRLVGNHIAVTGDRGRGAPRTSLTTWTGVVLDPAGWCPRSWDGLPAGALGGAGGGADTVCGRVAVRLTFSLAEVLSESPLESGSFVPSAPCSGRKSLCAHTSEWGPTPPHCTHFRAPAGSASLLPPRVLTWVSSALWNLLNSLGHNPGVRGSGAGPEPPAVALVVGRA